MRLSKAYSFLSVHLYDVIITCINEGFLWHRDKYEALVERDARRQQLNSVGHNHSRDSAIDADLQEWETETLEIELVSHCTEGVSGLWRGRQRLLRLNWYSSKSSHWRCGRVVESETETFDIELVSRHWRCVRVVKETRDSLDWTGKPLLWRCFTFRVVERETETLSTELVNHHTEGILGLWRGRHRLLGLNW